MFTIVNTNSPLTLDVPMSHGHHRDGARQPGHVRHAVHAGRGDGADHARRRARPAERRGARRHGCSPRSCGPAARSSTAASRSNVDMQSGAPAFGTPEYWKTAIVGGQLARRYDVPYRSSNTCAANAVDAQAAYESMFSLWGAVQGCCNFMMHGAGWMEGGLQAELREDGDRRRPAAHGVVDARPDRRRRRLAGVRRDRRGRPGRPLLRHRPHAGPLPLRVLPPADQRLAQLRDMAGRRQPGGRPARPTSSSSCSSREYEPPPMDAAVARGARGVRRPAGRRRRRARTTEP